MKKRDYSADDGTEYTLTTLQDGVVQVMMRRVMVITDAKKRKRMVQRKRK